jgi:biotin-(acetyl-CoA carboxylase) ligase
VGLGLNVRQRSFPAELAAERTVTSLALCGLDVTVERALEELGATLSGRFEQALQNDIRLARDWLAATGLSGCAVRLESGGECHSGTLATLDLEELELASSRGRTRFPLELVQALERA